MHANLDGFYNFLHPVVMPLLRRRQRVHIGTLSSVSGVIGIRDQTNYSASKAGIIGASKALALELASRAITVNCVAPGLIDTYMLNADVIERRSSAADKRGAPFAQAKGVDGPLERDVSRHRANCRPARLTK